MHRRTFVAVVGSTALGAGCVGQLGSEDAESTPTETPAATATETPGPTPTATPEPTATPASEPKISNIRQMAHWGEGEEAETHAVDGSLEPTPTYYEFDVALPVHDGSVAYDRRVTVTDEGGDTVFEAETSLVPEVDGETTIVTESPLIGIAPGELPAGTHDLSVTILDRLADGATDRATTDIGIVEPLEPDEVELAYAGTEKIDGWSNVRMNVRVTNTSDRDSGIDTDLSYKATSASESRYRSVGSRLAFDVPAGETRTYGLPGWDMTTDTRADKLTLRFDAYDFMWSVPFR